MLFFGLLACRTEHKPLPHQQLMDVQLLVRLWPRVANLGCTDTLLEGAAVTVFGCYEASEYNPINGKSTEASGYEEGGTSIICGAGLGVPEPRRSIHNYPFVVIGHLIDSVRVHALLLPHVSDSAEEHIDSLLARLYYRDKAGRWIAQGQQLIPASNLTATVDFKDLTGDRKREIIFASSMAMHMNCRRLLYTLAQDSLRYAGKLFGDFYIVDARKGTVFEDVGVGAYGPAAHQNYYRWQGPILRLDHRVELVSDPDDTSQTTYLRYYKSVPSIADSVKLVWEKKLGDHDTTYRRYWVDESEW